MFDLDNYSPEFAEKCSLVAKGIYSGENHEVRAIVANIIANRCSATLEEYKHLRVSDQVKVFKEFRFGLKETFKVFLKVTVHTVFRLVWLLSKKYLIKKKPEKVFKAWVEVNVDSWGKRYSSQESCILVLPFPLRLSRQLNFIRDIKKRAVYSLYGYDYRFKNLVKYFLRRDINSLAILELSAAFSYAKDILELGVDEVFHMDDVEVQSYVANKRLMNEKVVVNFRNHGIGRYSPYFIASNAVFFNGSQCAYYESLNQFDNKELMYALDREPVLVNSTFDHVVFVSQLINGLPSEYEQLEKRILAKLSLIGRELGFSLLVKLHPNGIDADFLRDYSSVENVATLNKDTTVFLTNYSTSYYTFEQFGATYLIHSKEVDPRIFFGDGERIINEAAFDNSASFTKAIYDEVVLFN